MTTVGDIDQALVAGAVMYVPARGIRFRFTYMHIICFSQVCIDTRRDAKVISLQHRSHGWCCMHKEACMQTLSHSRKERCMHQLSCYALRSVAYVRCTGKAFTRMSTQKQAQVLMVGDALCCSGHRPGTSLSVSRQGQL